MLHRWLMQIILEALECDQVMCHGEPEVLKIVSCSEGSQLSCAVPAGHCSGAAEPVPRPWEQTSSGVPGFSAKSVFSPSHSPAASPACCCSTVSQGSAPAAMSSASTSVTVLTTTVPCFREPGARHKQVSCDGA